MKVLLILPFLISILPNVLTQHPSTIVKEDHADALVQSFIQATGVAGLTVAVSQKGKTIYSKGFGYADIQNKRKMQVHNTIRTASVAKVITATAIGKLASDKRINFDDAISKYIPNLPPSFNSITIRQLAGHTSGIAHKVTNNAQEKKQYGMIAETLKFYKSSNIESAPNEQYQYSSAAFNLLAAVIEGASGMDYIDYLKENIFIPLGMTDTYAENINVLPPSASKAYYFKKEKLTVENKLVNGSYKLPGASFRSTSNDLTKLTSAYMDSFIKPEFVEDMFTSNTLNNGEKTEVGITWRINRDFKNRVVMDHAGSWQGARTVLVYYPQEQLSVAMMINTQSNIFIEETAQIIAHLFLQDGLSIAPSETSNKLSAKVKTRDGIEKCKGSLKIHVDGTGLLDLSSSNNAFQSMPLRSIGTVDDYCVATSFGLFYMQLNPKLKEGKVYLYANRRSKSPLEEDPLIAIKTID